MKRDDHHWVLAALCGISSACAGETSRATVVMRDSAGIAVVDHVSLTARDTIVWRVDTTPRFRIGSLDGPHAQLFGRIAGMTRLPDGTIAIADAQADEIRFFDSTGAHRNTLGRTGQGPNEYENLHELRPFLGDSLLAVDYEGMRFSVLTPGGSVVRRWRPTIRDTIGRGEGTAPDLEGTFADGSFLLSDYLNTCGRHTRGICTDSLRFSRVGASGELLAKYGTFATARTEAMVSPTGRRSYMKSFLPQVFWAVHGERWYLADATRFEIKVFNGRGGLDRIIRANVPPVTPPAVPGATIMVQEGAPPTAKSIDEMQRTIIEASKNAQPKAFDGLIVDALGYLWVKRYERLALPNRPGPTSASWWVFDSTGVFQQTVALPIANGAPKEIGTDYVLLERFDRAGFTQAVLLPLRRR